MSRLHVVVDSNSIVSSYGVCLSETHVPIENGILVETNLDLDTVILVGNYKLVDGELIELTEEEKPVLPQELSKLEILENEVILSQQRIADLEIEMLLLK